MLERVGVPRGRRGRWSGAGLVLGAAAAVVVAVDVAGPAGAEGSRSLYPSAVTATACAPNASDGSCRANIEWRTDRYGPTGGTQIYRRTLLSVYLQSGEVLLMGSSAVGVNLGDIVVYRPGVVTDRQGVLPAPVDGTNASLCSAQRTATEIAAQGRITTRAEEVGGPSAPTAAVDADHYVPCWFQASTGGIYDVAFYGPGGADAAGDGTVGGDLALTAAADTSASQGSSVAAWDLTVRADPDSTTDIDGRVFTYALAAFTAGNGRPVNTSFYVTTADGYRYRTDTRGLDPNGFLLYANSSGFRAPDGSPLDHDAYATAGGSAMSTLAGGVDFAPPQYPISFQPLATETLTALRIPTTPVAPTVTSAVFHGSIGGNNTSVAAGGTFHLDTNVAGVYQIVLSRDGTDFDPGNPVNRVLVASRGAGPQTVSWDGADNAGQDWPVGTDFPFRVSLRGGVYHFPLLDAENSTLGGPTFTLLNPPGSACPFGRSSCTTAFYDDRGYHTTSGDVGTPGSPLCGLAPPATSHSDPVTGFDSADTQRAYGQDTGGNTNAPCTGSFGDVKGLDTWTFFPSNVASSTLNVIASPPPAPVARDDSGTTTAGTTLTVSAGAGLLGNDTGTGLAVTAHTTPAHGTVAVGADGSYAYTPTAGYSGPDQFDYTVTDSYDRTATATVHLTVTPLAVPDAVTAPFGHPVSIPVLANDLGAGLVLTAVGQPPAGHGRAAVVAGEAVYTPSAGFSGRTTFTYTAMDAAGQPATSTVTVTISAPPRPVARGDVSRGAQGQPVTVDPLANDTPSHGARLVPSSVRLLDPVTGEPELAVLYAGRGVYTVDPTTGLVTFTPAPGYDGSPPTVRYEVRDTDGRVAVGAITVVYQTAARSATSLPPTGVTLLPLVAIGAGSVLLGLLTLGAAARSRRRPISCDSAGRPSARVRVRAPQPTARPRRDPGGPPG